MLIIDLISVLRVIILLIAGGLVRAIGELIDAIFDDDKEEHKE